MNESGLRSSMIALSMCNFMVAFMVSGVGACLPSIGNDLHASAGDLSLISAVYVLSLVIFNIVAAQLIAIMGQRRVFLYGFAIFLVMCLSLAFSPNVELVWGQRFIQGAGAAMVATSSVTLLISIAPRSMQGRLMGLLTASTYVGIALGAAGGRRASPRRWAGAGFSSCCFPWAFWHGSPCSVPSGCGRFPCRPDSICRALP